MSIEAEIEICNNREVTLKVVSENISNRQQRIVDEVETQGFASVEALAQQFEVTTQTIRRDVNQLCEMGLLQRHHGGVGRASSASNVAYQTRQVLCQTEKVRIAKLLAQHIPDKASVFINIGTTTEEVAKALIHHNGLRVITNNLNVATILSANEQIELIIAGGVVRSRDRGITGEATIDFIKQFKVDYGVIGISGIDEDGTLLDYDYNEVRVAQTIIENSRNIFLAADHTKFGRNAMVCMTNISAVDALFTDQKPPEGIVRLLDNTGVALHIA